MYEIKHAKFKYTRSKYPKLSTLESNNTKINSQACKNSNLQDSNM